MHTTKEHKDATRLAWTHAGGDWESLSDEHKHTAIIATAFVVDNYKAAVKHVAPKVNVADVFAAWRDILIPAWAANLARMTRRAAPALVLRCLGDKPKGT